MKKNVLQDKTFHFAVSVVKLSQEIREQNKKFVLTKQLHRSATSIGANVEEAIAARSTADFIAKLTITQKKPENPSIG